MEVDDGLVADSVFSHFGKANGRSVRFQQPDIDTIPVDVQLTNGILEDEYDEPEVVDGPPVRPKNKPRRRSRNSSSSKDDVDDKPSTASHATAPSKLRKLSEKDRHVSRTGKGRGKAKKGGGGGKGTWGRLSDEMDAETHTRDYRDPNYDSADEDTYIVSPSVPQMGIFDFQQHAETLFKEYFENADKDELVAVLSAMNIKNIKPEIIRFLVTQAMEKKIHCCEMASQLISYLCGKIINSREICTGFDILLHQLNDLSLDTPNAPEVLGNFIARAVADDCMPPSYVQNHQNLKEKQALEALKRAKILVGIRHSTAKLENIWGTSGGLQPLMQLIDKIALLLKEYLSSGDKDEALRCLQELAVPHFHHQVVYEAIVLVLESDSQHCSQMMTDLLCHLFKTALVTPDQFKQGFMRVFGAMSDIVLDVPLAYTTLSSFVDKSIVSGYISKEIATEMPQRGRKRFISEGDGGALKHPEH